MAAETLNDASAGLSYDYERYTFPARASKDSAITDELYGFFAWPPDVTLGTCAAGGSDNICLDDEQKDSELGSNDGDDPWFSTLVDRLQRTMEDRCNGAGPDGLSGTTYTPDFPIWYKSRFDALNATADLIKERKMMSIAKEESDLVPYVFVWSTGGHSVQLAGSFLNWGENVRMLRSGHEFSAIRELTRGVHHFKFIVDGEWRCSTTYPTETDANGNTNNVIDLRNFRNNLFLMPVEYEQAREAVYSQMVPNSADFMSDAPVIPVLLSKSSCTTVDTPLRSLAPLQALSNHLYHDSHAANILGPSVTAVTSTQRWRYSQQAAAKLSMAGLRFSTLTYVTFNPLFPCHGEPAFEIHAAAPLRCLLRVARHVRSRRSAAAVPEDSSLETG